MASAAAVGADAARSPIGNDIEESNGVTSAIIDTGEERREAEEDEDEDIQKRVRRPAKASADDEDEDGAGDGGVDDLFGDEEDPLADNPM